MTCKEFQNLLYSARIDELGTAEREFLEHHLLECDSCAAVFRQVSNADRFLIRIKETAPRIPNEEVLTGSIIAAIAGSKRQAANVRAGTILNRLKDVFILKAARFACALVFLFCGMTYLFMEYNDTKAIVSLEHRLGNQSISNHADVFYQGINILNFLHDFYNFSNGNASSVELTKTLVIIKKADLQALLKDYKTLDEASKARLNAMYDKYIEAEPSLLPGSEKNREETAALRNEIKRLKMELEQSNNTKVQP
ncbi:MAG: zf-HC2 domain-containing protein [Bacteroidota bacterium]